jgi:DNA polymerase-3 subunit delta'
MEFSGFEIKGQDSAIAYLKGVVKSGRIPPTLMFVGKNGVGRFLTAVAFTTSLNCKGEDLFCKEHIKTGLHPNVHIVGRNKDIISIDDVRTMINDSFVPLSNGYRVNILDNGEKSTLQAFNSMLKYLEEPPERTVNILIVHDETDLLETIRSRAVKVRFNPLPSDVIYQYLVKKNVDKDRAFLVSHFANGSFENIDLYVSDEFLDNRKQFLTTFFSFLLNESTSNEVYMSWQKLFSELSQKENAIKFFDFVSLVIRDILFISILHEKDKIVNVDFTGLMAEKFSIIKKRTLSEMFDIVKSGREALFTNANPQYIVMNALFSMKEVIR